MAYTRNDDESFYFEPSTMYIGTHEGYGRRGYYNFDSKVLETTLRYNTDFGKNSIQTVLGYSFQEDMQDGFSAQGRQPFNNYTMMHDLTLFQSVNPGDISSFKNTNRLISFFGAFELTLPSSWVNKMDSKAESSGGLIGVFLMAFVLVLVSFSCTGPIIGTLLVQAAVSGSWLSPMLGMAGFATALAVPFSLLAIFPSMLGNLPKSGGWLNSVKVVLAFILVAFSLKFLSVADAVGQWGLLSRDTFIAIWITLFTLMGFYLLGKIKFSNDSDVPYISVTRLFFVIVTFSFVVYLIPGMWGAPLNAISAFTPSMTTQEYNLQSAGQSSSSTSLTLTGDYSSFKTKQGVYGLTMFLDYDEGVQYAKTVDKPVFLDFTGHGCSNCKKMHQSVWSDQRVLQRLAEEYIIISLYVDERTALPIDEQYVSDFGGKQRKIKSVGAKWSDFQARNYGVNSQPYYVLLDNDENRLAEPYGFNTNIDEFLAFLDKGIEGYKAGK